MNYRINQNIFSSEDIFDQLLASLNSFCKLINDFAVIFFLSMKFIFAFMMLVIGALTLVKLRGIYKMERTGIKSEKKSESQLRKPRLVLGIIYIIMGIGILTGYFTSFLIWILEPIPDRFLFSFINFHGEFNPNALNRIVDINKAIYEYEKTIYYAVAVVSLVAIMNVVLSVWYLINDNNRDPKKKITCLLSGIVMGMLVGWTPCLPLLM